MTSDDEQALDDRLLADQGGEAPCFAHLLDELDASEPFRRTVSSEETVGDPAAPDTQ